MLELGSLPELDITIFANMLFIRKLNHLLRLCYVEVGKSVKC